VAECPIYKLGSKRCKWQHKWSRYPWRSSSGPKSNRS